MSDPTPSPDRTADDRYKASYYNRALPDGDDLLLFNGVTSGLMRLPSGLGGQIAPFLGPHRGPEAGQGLAEWEPPRFGAGDLPADLREVLPELVRGRFFVPADEDELDFLRQRTERIRRRDPFLVTLTATLDCNFDCYYCYEDKSPIRLSRERCDQILDYVTRRMEEKGHPKLYTDWYGGEPMLNREVMEYFTPRALEICERLGAAYRSGLISNGTHWPEDARGFAERHHLKHVQITLDGPPRHHDVRRAYKDHPDRSSFAEVSATIDRLRGGPRLFLRINVDPGIGRSALEMVDLCRERGWLEPGARIYPYLAPIGPMTEHCGFIGDSRKFDRFHDEFERIKEEFQARIAEHLDRAELEHLQIYPATRYLSCAAVGDNSVIFGPDGALYKCSLDVGMAGRHFARLPDPGTSAGTSAGTSEATGSSPLVVLQDGGGSGALPYQTYDPFGHERCSQCQYLPMCMGGCPKTWFEGNEFYLKRRDAYWETRLEPMIRNYAAHA